MQAALCCHAIRADNCRDCYKAVSAHCCRTFVLFVCVTFASFVTALIAARLHHLNSTSVNHCNVCFQPIYKSRTGSLTDTTTASSRRRILSTEPLKSRSREMLACRRYARYSVSIFSHILIVSSPLQVLPMGTAVPTRASDNVLATVDAVGVRFGVWPWCVLGEFVLWPDTTRLQAAIWRRW